MPFDLFGPPLHLMTILFPHRPFRIPKVTNFEPPCLRPANKEPNSRRLSQRRHMTISESAEEVMMKQIVSRMQDPFEGLEVVI